MAYSATVSATDNIFIHNPKSFTFTESGRSEKIVDELQQEIGFVKKATAFFYNNRIRLHLGAGTDQREFVLLKGLIEFHRTKDFIFSYDKGNRSIEADIHESSYVVFRSFLLNVNQWLKDENSFRLALREAIAFEAKYKSERAAVYATFVK